MIAFLNGTLAGKSPTQAFIDVGGVGYAVNMAASALARLPETGSAVRVLTYLQVSDNGVALFGFWSREEKMLFEKLIAVSGVGPKMALAALSTFSPTALAQAVAAGDSALLAKIPGVGKKTASRMILELKGSLDDGLNGLFAEQGGAEAAADAAMSGVAEALVSMGFTTAEADLALKGAPAGAGESALLQYALKRLGS